MLGFNGEFLPQSQGRSSYNERHTHNLLFKVEHVYMLVYGTHNLIFVKGKMLCYLKFVNLKSQRC